MQAANYGAMSKSVTLSRVLPSEPRTVGHPKMLAEHTFRGVLTVESRHSPLRVHRWYPQLFDLFQRLVLGFGNE